MQLGTFSVMDYHPDRQGSAAGFYRDMLDLAVTAEQLGYESVWVAEHHFANYGLCPAPPVLLAAMAQQTQRIRLGPAVCVLPFHDPVKVAEEYAVLDVVSNGRLELGVGRGYLAHEYAGHLMSWGAAFDAPALGVPAHDCVCTPGGQGGDLGNV